MQLMDQALLAAIKGKEIDPDDAFAYSTDKRLFAEACRGSQPAAAHRTRQE